MKRLIVYISMLFLVSACGSGPVFDLSKINDQFDAVSFNNKVDILWVMDTSTTMDDDRQRLSSQINRMIQTMDSKKIDYRMAMVTMDLGSNSPASYADGNFIGSPKVITRETRDKVKAFADMIDVPPAQSNFEQGLAAMKRALSAEKLATVNNNFYRADALLAVVFVTDEKDWSNGTWEDYATHLDSFKANLENGNKGWVANFIGVTDSSSSCTTTPGVPVRGDGFIEIANYSNGSVNSICHDSLTSAVENINRTIVNIITEWKLAQEPLIETIVVKMNGQIIPQNDENGWSYNAEKNTVVFHGTAIPASDTKVEVNFKPKKLEDN